MRHLLLASLLLVPVVAHAKPSKAKATTSHAKSSSKAFALTKVVWHNDYDAAAKEAKRTGKPMFVDFYTDWCGACKILDQTTYKDPKFVRASRNWVMVKVNAEKGARNIQIAQKYRPEGYPTMLMLDGKGKKLNQVIGSYPTDMLIAEMRKAEKNMGVLMAQSPHASHAG